MRALTSLQRLQGHCLRARRGLVPPHRPCHRPFAGHSKWHNIRQRKGAQDKKRAAQFLKLSAEIQAAARGCSGDLENPRLQTAIGRAKQFNMPKDNIQAAVDRGVKGGGDSSEQTRYEGYGPASVAVIVEVLTNSTNRTSKEVRHLFSKHGGNMAESGAVSWNFDRLGCVHLDGGGSSVDMERLFDVALEVGAEDVVFPEDDDEDGEGGVGSRVLCDPTAVASVGDGLRDAGFQPTLLDLIWLPKDRVTVLEDDAESFANFLEALEDHDDVQRVFHNAEESEE